MIIAILFLFFLLIGLVIGTQTKTVGQILKETNEWPGITDEPPILSANYYTIAKLERAMNQGNSYHNGLPRDNDKPCQCNTICHPETFYIPDPISQANIKAQDKAEEWRDRGGE